MVRWAGKSDAFGYYVHYHVENYKKYGIGYKTPGVSAAAAWNENHQKILSISKMGKTIPNAKALEHFLNGLFNNRNENNIDFNSYDVDVNDLESIFYEAMESRFPLYSAKFDFLNLEAVNSEFENNINTYRGKWAKDKYVMMHTIKRRIDMLKIWINEIKAMIATGKVKESAVMSQMKKATDALNTLENIVDSAPSKQITFSSEDEFNVMKKALNVVGKVAQPTSKDIGVAGEMGLSILFALMEQDGKSSLNSLIQKINTGSKKQTQRVLPGGGFLSVAQVYDAVTTDKRGKKINFREYEIGDDGSIMDITGSDMTADLTISLPNGNRLAQEMGISDFAMSLKNYSYGGVNAKIHVLSGTPLLTALSFFTTNFANHYLNLFAETSQGDSFGALQAAYSNELKNTLLIRALMGVRDFQAGFVENDLFVVHDTTSGNFRVWGAAELARDYIINHPNKITLENNGTTDDPILTNQWVGEKGHSMESAIARIGALVASAHKYKLSLSITLN